MEPKTELQKNAIAEARKNELETYQRALDIQWLNSRMEDGRMGRCLALIQKEAEMEKDFQERTDHAAIVNARAEKETALGIEVAKVSREDACELLRRHYLRERDPGLRELVKKLQAGYVRRDLQQQILHNEYKRLQDKAEEEHANRVLRNALYNDQEERTRSEALKIEKDGQYRLQLQQQLVSRQRERQCRYEDTLVEKKMLDDIMRTIADEDQREMQQKREQTEKMRREMDTFRCAKEAWKEKQKQLAVREERGVEEQRRAAADRSAAVIAERERKVQMKEAINQKIAAKILADEAARQERENLIKLLQEQEFLEKNVQDDIAEKQKFERVKTDTHDALTGQMDRKIRDQREQREREADFRKSVEEKMAAEDEKEKKKELKKKESAQKYALELRQQIRDNTRQRERDRAREQARVQRVWEQHRLWDEEVVRERARVVEQHAGPLLAFLQPGALRPADLPAARRGARGGEQPDAGIEALASTDRPKRFPKCNAQCRILREF